MAKNIVVFSDGTGQEGGTRIKSGTRHNTNVYKTFQMIESRSERQISFYDRGLGTRAGKILSTISTATGAGFSRNILECYQFIFDNYSDGDKIFLFGFSRGAATVRSLAGFIDLFGILPDSRPELIKRAYEIYKINDETTRLKQADDFVQLNSNLWCDIHFLGVWDTVSALGIPSRGISLLLDKLPIGRHRFHDFKLSRRVRHARHAMAIDDERKTFHPTPWREDLVMKHQTLKQVWFAGMHTDVGGGYRAHGLSDIPFNWMIREAIRQGLRIYARHEVESQPSELGAMHDSCSGAIGGFFKCAERTWPPKAWRALTPASKVGKPTVHESVVLRAAASESDENRETAEKARDAAERAGEATKRLPYDPWILKLESGYATEKARNDAEELTTLFERLYDEKHLGLLDQPTVGDQGKAIADRLGKLRSELAVELAIAHALVPRGTPEDREEDKKGEDGLDPERRALETAQRLRRRRGEDRGFLFEEARKLLVSISALTAELKALDLSWERVERRKRDVETTSELLYEYYTCKTLGEVYEDEAAVIEIMTRLRRSIHDERPGAARRLPRVG